MRTTRTTQRSLFDPNPVDHPVAGDLERVSAWLDAPSGAERGGRVHARLWRTSRPRCTPPWSRTT